MTKIRDMATIRPLKKATDMRITTATPTKRTLPAPLRAHIEKGKQEAAQFREVVLMAIEDLAHPVTVAEVQKHVGMELNKEFNQPRIRYAFDALLADGRLHARLETSEERILRFNGARPIAGKAVLYYPASLADHVPERTKPQVVEGSTLTGRTNWSTEAKKTAKKKTVAARGSNIPAGQPTGALNNEALDFMIEKVIAARHADLIQELAETKARLEKIKQML